MAMANPTEVLVADDQPFVLDGFRTILGAEGYHVRVASTPADAERELRATAPQLLVLGFLTPGVGSTGLELLSTIHRRWPDLPIMIWSPADDRNLEIGVRNLGARGFLLTSASPEELCHAVRAVLGGEPVFRPTPRPTELLTPRQLEIVQASAIGKNHTQISRRLGISRGRVNQHLAAARGRLGAQGNQELITMARERRLLGLPPEALRRDGRREDGRTEGRKDGRTEGRKDPENRQHDQDRKILWRKRPLPT